MDYDMKKPCDACPFKRGTPLTLREGRVEEIVNNMLASDGGAFPCHKTIEHSEDDDESFTELPNCKHCAGALIFAEKHGRATQGMRLAERFSGYDAAALMADKEALDSVFDDFEEMLEWLTRKVDSTKIKC